MATQPKINLYKFVSIPSGKKAPVGSSLVRAFNSIGATLNSSVIITKQLYNVVLKDTQDRIKNQEKLDRASQRSRDAASEKSQEGGKSAIYKKVKNFFSSETPNFFRGIANLLGFVFRAFVIKNILDWVGNPANREKLVTLLKGIGSFFNFLWGWAKSGIGNTLDGLTKMFGNGNWIEKLLGFGQFIAGIATLFFGMRWLKNPLNLVKDFRFVLSTLWRSLTSTKAKLAGRAGLGVVRAVATNPYVLGAAAIGGAAYLANTVTGQNEGAKVQAAQKAKERAGTGISLQGVGGTGDMGPAGSMPTLEKAADGGIKQQGSRMQPLSALPSYLGRTGNGSAKTTSASPSRGKDLNSSMINKISQAMMLPFKVVGAGLLAAMAGSLAMMGPIGGMIGPLVSSIMGPVAGYFGVPDAMVKSIASKGKKFNLGNSFGLSGLTKLFGTAKSIKSGKSKEYKPSGDTTVLGLLSDIVGALALINSKVDKKDDTNPPPTSTPPPASPQQKKAELPSGSKPGDSKVQALEGTKADLSKKGYDYVPNSGNKFWKDKQGRIYNAKTSGNTSGFLGIGSQEKYTLSAASQQEIDAANTPKKEIGGWISGPMTGFPVSLDGGNSVSFIGHGKEWVGGFSKGGNTGNAFVIPYDTPATRKDPFLTSKRYAQASKLGARLPDQSRLQDRGMAITNTAPGRADGGIVSAAQKAISEGKQGPASPPCASWVRMVLGMAGNPAAGKVTQKGDLDPEKKTWGANMAASFAGSDMGSVVKGQSALEPGDIVLHKNTYGNFPDGAITHVSIAAGDGQVYHQSTTGGRPKKSSIWNFAAGIRLGGSGTINGSGSDGADEAASFESSLDLIRQGQNAIRASQGLSPATPPQDATTATTQRDKARRDAADRSRTGRTPPAAPVAPLAPQTAQAQAGARAAIPIGGSYQTSTALDPFSYTSTFSLWGNS